MRQSPSPWIYIGVVVILAIVLIFSLYKSTKENAVKNIADFESCAKAGFPIMESYPEQCRTPDGRTFVHQVSQPTGSLYDGLNEPSM